ncbi:hypothetical protein RFI_23722, partial [Reticulomyxa filosa]
MSEKKLVWNVRYLLTSKFNALPVVLRSVDWRDPYMRTEMYHLLYQWSRPNTPENALELLHFEFSDARVRHFAVIMCLAELCHFKLKTYLLQIVQCLKIELHHYSVLAHFILQRAIQAPYLIGHHVFWLCK